MVVWLIGIGIAGFFIGLWGSIAMRPEGIGARLGRPAVARWWAGSLAIAAVAVGLALLFAWPMWQLGQWLAPYVEVSPTTGGAICACIFGVGGAALTGVLSVDFNERYADSRTPRDPGRGPHRR